ncbi:MAG: TetR/AcrR family transcriptional regulator [Chloroflexota bacterium]|nr:MAG: TetR/AcrR family transcriptional regulator [Chloroflexota bacterium]
MTDSSGKRKGKYHAPRREAAARETRRRIRQAAHELFLSHGYAATSISEVARQAGVTDRTVYLAFTNKAGLLQSVVETAIVGDDALIPVASRDIWTEMMEAAPRLQLALFAADTTELYARAAAVFEVAEAAADGDPEIAVLRQSGRRRRLSDFRLIADSLARKGALRPEVNAEEATDVLYTLASDGTYRMLVTQRGWSIQRFQTWLAETLATSLLGDFERQAD